MSVIFLAIAEILHYVLKINRFYFMNKNISLTKFFLAF